MGLPLFAAAPKEHFSEACVKVHVAGLFTQPFTPTLHEKWVETHFS